jgi:integrase
MATQRLPAEPLFGFGRTGKLRHRQVFWRAVGDICHAAGIPRVCPHSLRGLWATLGVQSGAVLHAVAASLGHGSFSMTERHYAQPEAVSGAKTARMVEMLSLSSEGASTEPEQTAEQLLRSLPREVLDSLVTLHRRNGK